MTTETTETTVTTVTVREVVGFADLHLQYRGQFGPQRVHVEFDPESRTLTAAPDGEIGGGTPFRVWHRRAIRWNIPALTSTAANALLEELAPVCERIADGYACVWDGNNNVGRYDDDAEAAIEEAHSLCDRSWSDEETIAVWDASEYFGGVGDYEAQREILGITAETTDEEIAAIVEREEAATPYGVILEDTERHFLRLRDDARSDDSDDDSDE